MKQRVGVVVCDTHRLSRVGLVRLLAEEDDINLLGECDRGEEAIRMMRDQRADVLLVDMEVPDLGGLEVARRLGRGVGRPGIVPDRYPRGRSDSGPVSGERRVLLPHPWLRAGRSGDGGAPGLGRTTVRGRRCGAEHDCREAESERLANRDADGTGADGDGDGMQRLRPADHIRTTLFEPQDREYVPNPNHAQARCRERRGAYASVVSARAAGAA